MIRIVLYSGGQSKSNRPLHKEVVRLARAYQKARGSRAPLTMTYFPFCNDGAETFFKRIVRRYRAFGVKRFFCLSADAGPSREEIKVALQSDVIYLAGGNTFYFLFHLRKAGLLQELKRFSKKGGVLVGLSAGAMILGPTVASAADPRLEPDENEVGLGNFRGLKLYSFEVSPHFDFSKKSTLNHALYSNKTNNLVFAIPDGGGIVIEGKRIRIKGPYSCFKRGKLIHEHTGLMGRFNTL